MWNLHSDLHRQPYRDWFHSQQCRAALFPKFNYNMKVWFIIQKCVFFLNSELHTNNIQVSQLTFHRICIYLTLKIIHHTNSDSSKINPISWILFTIYHPWSASLTSLICNCQARFPVLAMPILWFLVITWCWILKIVWVSTRSQATCVDLMNELRLHTNSTLTLTPKSYKMKLSRLDKSSRKAIC